MMLFIVNIETTKSTKCSLFQTTRELLENKTNLQALTLVGPTRKNPIPDPLVVLHPTTDYLCHGKFG